MLAEVELEPRSGPRSGARVLYLARCAADNTKCAAAQASDGSKRSVDDECNVAAGAPADSEAAGAAGANGKRIKVQHSRALTEDEKAQRRRAGPSLQPRAATRRQGPWPRADRLAVQPSRRHRPVQRPSALLP